MSDGDGRVRVLLADPSGTDGDAALERAADGVSVDVVTGGPATLDRLDEGEYDCLVVRGKAGADGRDPVALLEEVGETHPDLPTVLAPVEGSERLAARAVSAGVSEYVPGGEREDALAAAVRAAVPTTRSTAGAGEESSLPADGAVDPTSRVGDVLERISDAFFALDDEWRFTYLNDKAAELIDVDRHDVIGEEVWEVFPEAVDSPFEREYRRAMESQASVSFEEFYPPLDTWFAVRAYPSETGLSVYFRDVTAEKARQRREREQRERLTVLNDLNSVAQEIAEAVVRQSTRAEIEALVCDRLAASDAYAFAWIGECTDGDAVEVRAEDGASGYLDDLHGDADPVERGPCARCMETGEPQVVTDVLEGAHADPWRARAREYGYRAVGAFPITFQDTSYGVLNVYSERPDAFSREEGETLGRLGTIVAHALRSVERERRYRTVVENVPDGAVVLVDDDRRYRTVEGTVLDRLDLTSEQFVGRRATEVDALPDALGERLDETYGRALDGETSTIEFDLDGFTFELRTVPVGEEGDPDAAMALAQDVTERKRRERELAHERERLEFLNRLIRHNLLNSLNLVNARLDLVGDDLPPEHPHFETAKERTEEMIDLIETMRVLMRAVTEGDDRDLEPVVVREPIEDRVETARHSFPDAEFEVTGDLDVAVAADDLLGEALENLLVNAVQHNDRETPVVEVTVEAAPEWIAIGVADNGPGVSEDLRRSIFEKGTKGFESPGTGFGLHLVREIVDSYGGTVTVEDDDPRGAVFRLELPRA